MSLINQEVGLVELLQDLSTTPWSRHILEGVPAVAKCQMRQGMGKDFENRKAHYKYEALPFTEPRRQIR